MATLHRVDELHTPRGVVVRIVATATSGDPAEERLVRDAGVTYGHREGTWAYFGDLGPDARRRLGILLAAAERYGTELTLGVSYPHVNYHGRVLPTPVAHPNRPSAFEEQHDFVEPSHVDTMLVLDAQYAPGGASHQWWLSAEPPRGTHPDPAGAWDALCALDGTGPFAPAPRTYARPAEPGVVAVQGMWRGRWVQATFNRADDAEQDRWQRLRPLLQPR